MKGILQIISSSTLLPWTGTPSHRPHYTGPYPAWPCTFPEMEHPQLLWTTCSSASLPSVKYFFLIPNVNLPSFRSKPFPLVLSLHALVESPSGFSVVFLCLLAGSLLPVARLQMLWWPCLGFLEVMLCTTACSRGKAVLKPAGIFKFP